jgi:hypothetical protein
LERTVCHCSFLGAEDGLSLLHFGRKMFAPSKKGFSGASFGHMHLLAPNALNMNNPQLIMYHRHIKSTEKLAHDTLEKSTPKL